MKKKHVALYKWGFGIVLFFLMFLAIGRHSSVSAEWFEESKTIKWDMDNDGKKEKVKFVPVMSSEYCFDELRIYVNGKLQRTIEEDEGHAYSVDKITLKNGKRFLLVTVDAGPSPFQKCLLYHYSGGKLIRDARLNDDVGKICKNFGASFTKVKGNKVYINVFGQTKGLASMNYEVVYKYSGGKLKLASQTHKVYGYGSVYEAEYNAGGWGPDNMNTPLIRTSKKIKIYSDKTCKTYAKTLKKGTLIQITKIYISAKYTSYYVKGKGWIKIKNSGTWNYPISRDVVYVS